VVNAEPSDPVDVDATATDVCRTLPVPSHVASREDAARAAAVFKTLSDTSRAFIVLSLGHEERCVSDLADAVNMSPPAVCHHLQILLREGIVSATRRGREVFYAVDQTRLRQQIQGSLVRVGLADGPTCDADRPILIGSALPLTGFGAADGLEQKRALELALDEWSSRGGVLGRPVEHVIVDVGDMSTKRMLHAFRTLVEDYGVDAIVNGYMIYSGEENEIVSETATPYISLNTSHANQGLYAAEPEKYWMCFQCVPSDRVYGFGFPPFLHFLEAHGFRPRERRIAVLYAQHPYAMSAVHALRASIGSSGWRVSLFEPIEVPCEDWRTVMTKLHAVQPDVVFLADALLEDAITFVNAFREYPTQSLAYILYAPTLREFVERLGPSAEGTITSTIGGLVPGPVSTAFVAAYSRRWGVHPGTSVGGALYDAANLFLTAVSLAGGPEDRRRVCECMRTLWLRGTSGVHTFTHSHGTLSYPSETRDPASGLPHLFAQIQDGEPKIINPPPYAQSQFVLPPWF
jgi:branched-chain amino acid transport system substrate-binding protein